jgi:hypothetical protein
MVVTHENKPRAFSQARFRLRTAIDAARSSAAVERGFGRGSDDLLCVDWMYGHDVFPPGQSNSQLTQEGVRRKKPDSLCPTFFALYSSVAVPTGPPPGA